MHRLARAKHDLKEVEYLTGLELLCHARADKGIEKSDKAQDNPRKRQDKDKEPGTCHLG